MRTKLRLVAEPRKLHRLAEIWNEHMGSGQDYRGDTFYNMRRVTRMTAERMRLCEERMQEEPDEQVWIEAVKRAAATEFCTGGNDRGWRGTFDWFIRPGTLAKIEEGFFDDRPRARF